MALDGGSVNANGDGTGLAKALYDAFEDEYGPFEQRVRTSITPFCTRLANTIIDYFVSNTEVTVTIPTDGDGQGLQRSTAAGLPTDAPTTPKDIEGVIT